MARFSRINPDSFYANGLPLPATWWETIDTNLSKSINGDAGGTWNPSAPIIIGGAGLGVGSQWTVNAAASLSTVASSGQRILHGDNDYIQLQAGSANATRTLVTHCGRFAEASEADAAFTFTNPLISPAAAYSGTNCAPANTSGAISYRLLIPLRVHNGATFTQAVFWFSVLNTHSGVPATMPQFRIYKVDVFGTITPLRTASTLANGFEPFPTPGSGAAWTAANAAQSFTYTLDVGVVVDDSTYQYYAEIIDENGTNSVNGVMYSSVDSTFTTIPDMRPQ